MLEGIVEKVFTPEHLDRLAACGELLDRVPLSGFDDDRAAALLGRAEIIVGHWGTPTLTAEVLERSPRLEMFAYAAGTVKWQVTDAVWDRDLLVTSAAAMNAVPVAEYTIAMILLSNKGVFRFREHCRNQSSPLPREMEKLGNFGKRVGVVGASFVGRKVIELLHPYDLEVSVYDPYLSHVEAKELGVEKFEELDELCSAVDVLTLHAPDIEATRAMIGAAQLSLLRDGATFINTARPALVDQIALEAELSSGRIDAVLDVATPDPLPRDSLLLSLPNVFATPHIAGASGNELVRLAQLAVEEVERFTRGEPPLFRVCREDMSRIA